MHTHLRLLIALVLLDRTEPFLLAHHGRTQASCLQRQRQAARRCVLVSGDLEDLSPLQAAAEATEAAAERAKKAAAERNKTAAAEKVKITAAELGKPGTVTSVLDVDKVIMPNATKAATRKKDTVSEKLVKAPDKAVRTLFGPLLCMLGLLAWPWILKLPLLELRRAGLLPGAEAILAQLAILQTICARTLVAAGCGAVIGLERKDADRPAGLRSLTLVSTGSALYVLSALYAPQIAGQGDAARTSAQVCTGVGFIGAGVIAKGNKSNDPVRGVTTACAVWVAAAVGVVAACGLPLFAIYTCGLTVSILRMSRWFNAFTKSKLLQRIEATMGWNHEDASDADQAESTAWRRSASGRIDISE